MARYVASVRLWRDDGNDATRQRCYRVRVTQSQKHGVSFRDAQLAFFDPMRVIAADVRHTTVEEARYFCFGKVGDRVATVRFTIRGEQIRIFGAGYWREGRRRYEQQQGV